MLFHYQFDTHIYNPLVKKFNRLSLGAQLRTQLMFIRLALQGYESKYVFVKMSQRGCTIYG